MSATEPHPLLAADNKEVEDVLIGNLSTHHSPLSKIIRIYVSSEWAGTDYLLRYSVYSIGKLFGIGRGALIVHVLKVIRSLKTYHVYQLYCVYTTNNH